MEAIGAAGGNDLAEGHLRSGGLNGANGWAKLSSALVEGVLFMVWQARRASMSVPSRGFDDGNRYTIAVKDVLAPLTWSRWAY